MASSHTTESAPPAAIDRPALDKATDGAVQAYKNMGHDVGTSEIRAAQERAQAIIKASQEKGITGSMVMNDQEKMHAMSAAIGMPVPRIMFSHMIDCAEAPIKTKEAWISDLQEIENSVLSGKMRTRTGCMELKFRDTSGALVTAYFVLDACTDAHDFGAELEKIYTRISPDQHDVIRKHMSVLLYFGRTAFFNMFTMAQDLMEEISAAISKTFNYQMLKMDPANTTLYLPPPCTVRVGMFVRFASELEVED